MSKCSVLHDRSRNEGSPIWIFLLDLDDCFNGVVVMRTELHSYDSLFGIPLDAVFFVAFYLYMTGLSTI